MLNVTTVLFIIGFAVSQTGAYVCLRFASQETGLRMASIFLLGNIIGFGSPVCLTMALKNANPNIIYAMCIGGSFFILQFVSSAVFQRPLNFLQWMGILLIGIGLLFVQMQSREQLETVDSSPAFNVQKKGVSQDESS